MTELEDLPIEIIELILHELFRSRQFPTQRTSDFRSVNLVCQNWRTIVERSVFTYSKTYGAVTMNFDYRFDYKQDRFDFVYNPLKT